MGLCEQLSQRPGLCSVGGAQLRHGHPAANRPMITTIFLAIWKLFLPLLFLVAVIDWLTASTDRRVRILRTTGMSQKRIAERLNLSTYRVRKALTT